MKITNEKEAKQTWQKLGEKYIEFAKSLFVEKPLPKESRSPEKFAEKQKLFEASAKKIQKSWRKFLKTAPDVPMHPEGYHSAPFLYFLNPKAKNAPAQVFKSLDKPNQEKLLKALQSSDWQADIFNHKKLPEIAAALFDAGKISMPQFFTILERNQINARKDLFPIENTFQILDENNQFTEEAKKYLLPQLTQANPHGLLILDFKNRQLKTAEDLEAFRLLIAELPKSEQIFSLIKADYLLSKLNTPQEKLKEWAKTGPGALGLDLINRGTIYLNRKANQIIHFSFGARDAIGIAEFDIDHYAPIFPRLNKQDLDNIEHGVRRGFRPAAVAYPGTVAYTNIHGYIALTDFEATEHDYYHGQGLSSLKLEARKAIFYSIDLLREITGFKWSKEMWTGTDLEFLIVKDRTAIDQFKHIFNYLFLGEDPFAEKIETKTGALIILMDMLAKEKEWNQFGLGNIREFLNELIGKDNVRLIEEIIEDKEIDNLFLKIAILKVIFTLKAGGGSEEEVLGFIKEAKVIDELKQEKFEFYKTKYRLYKNFIEIGVDKTEIDIEKYQQAFAQYKDKFSFTK